MDAVPGLLFAVSAVCSCWRSKARSRGTPGSVISPPNRFRMCLPCSELCWALYSNLSRRYGPPSGVGAQPLFVLGAGVILLLFRAFAREQPSWTPAACLMLAFTSVFTVTLAYAFGIMPCVPARSCSWPNVLSDSGIVTALSAVLLGIKPGVVVWAACVLVVAGALVCRASVVEDRVDRFRG